MPTRYLQKIPSVSNSSILTCYLSSLLWLIMTCSWWTLVKLSGRPKICKTSRRFWMPKPKLMTRQYGRWRILRMRPSPGRSPKRHFRHPTSQHWHWRYTRAILIKTRLGRPTTPPPSSPTLTARTRSRAIQRAKVPRWCAPTRCLYRRATCEKYSLSYLTYYRRREQFRPRSVRCADVSSRQEGKWLTWRTSRMCWTRSSWRESLLKSDQKSGPWLK